MFLSRDESAQFHGERKELATEHFAERGGRVVKGETVRRE